MKIWLAIEPTAGEVRYLRDGLRIPTPAPPAEIAVAYQPAETPADAIPGLPPRSRRNSPKPKENTAPRSHYPWKTGDWTGAEAL